MSTAFFLSAALLATSVFTAFAADSPWPAPVPGFVAPKAGEHPRMLFRLTGEQKYADLGRQCAEKMLEGQRDRDDRYSFVGPHGALRAGPSLGAGLAPGFHTLIARATSADAAVELSRPVTILIQFPLP